MFGDTVSFKNYIKFGKEGLTNDEKINQIIINSNSVYYLSWGIYDNNNVCYPIDDIETDAKEYVCVLNSVFGIFLLPNSFFY